MSELYGSETGTSFQRARWRSAFGRLLQGASGQSLLGSFKNVVMQSKTSGLFASVQRDQNVLDLLMGV